LVILTETSPREIADYLPGFFSLNFNSGWEFGIAAPASRFRQGYSVGTVGLAMTVQVMLFLVGRGTEVEMNL
jgi:hypothetical protein